VKLRISIAVNMVLLLAVTSFFAMQRTEKSVGDFYFPRKKETFDADPVVRHALELRPKKFSVEPLKLDLSLIPPNQPLDPTPPGGVSYL